MSKQNLARTVDHVSLQNHLSFDVHLKKEKQKTLVTNLRELAPIVPQGLEGSCVSGPLGRRVCSAILFCPREFQTHVQGNPFLHHLVPWFYRHRCCCCCCCCCCSCCCRLLYLHRFLHYRCHCQHRHLRHLSR